MRKQPTRKATKIIQQVAAHEQQDLELLHLQRFSSRDNLVVQLGDLHVFNGTEGRNRSLLQWVQLNCGYDRAKDGKRFPTDPTRQYTTLFDQTYQASEGASYPCSFTVKHQVWLDSWVKQFPVTASIPGAMVCVKMIVLCGGTREQDPRAENTVNLHSDGSYPPSSTQTQRHK